MNLVSFCDKVDLGGTKLSKFLSYLVEMSFKTPTRRSHECRIPFLFPL